MKKLSLLVAAFAITGAFELALASNNHINVANNAPQIVNRVTDTVPGKKSKKTPADPTRTPNPDPTPSPNPTPSPIPTPTPNPTPSPSPAPSPNPIPTPAPPHK